MPFLENVMNFSDFLIIYLACGTPFGVYYFLQNRKSLHRNKLWLNAFLTTTVWFPYAVRLFQRFITNRLNVYTLARFRKSEAIKKNEIDKIEKEISQMLLSENSKLALFDFRETYQRYTGLTTALQNTAEDALPPEREKELFRIAGTENVEFGAKCLQRRNLKRLRFHQNLARQDLIKMFGAINAELKSSEEFRSTVSDFFRFLNDPEAESAFGEIVAFSLQTSDDFNVRDLEKDLWKPREEQPSLTSQKTLNLQALPLATTIRKGE